jgi:hypothetical protein
MIQILDLGTNTFITYNTTDATLNIFQLDRIYDMSGYLPCKGMSRWISFTANMDNTWRSKETQPLFNAFHKVTNSVHGRNIWVSLLNDLQCITFKDYIKKKPTSLLNISTERAAITSVTFGCTTSFWVELQAPRKQPALSWAIVSIPMHPFFLLAATSQLTLIKPGGGGFQEIGCILAACPSTKTIWVSLWHLLYSSIDTSASWKTWVRWVKSPSNTIKFLRNHIRRTMTAIRSNCSLLQCSSRISNTCIKLSPEVLLSLKMIGPHRHTSCATGQLHKMWRTYSSSLPQSGHNLSSTIPLRNRFTFVGSRLLQALHMNCLIVLCTLRLHTAFHISISSQLVSSHPCCVPIFPSSDGRCYKQKKYHW